MKKNRNMWAKIMAFFALFWIIVWVIWTWALFIIDWWYNQDPQLTQEELDRIIKQLEQTNSWTTAETQIDIVENWEIIEEESNTWATE